MAVVTLRIYHPAGNKTDEATGTRYDVSNVFYYSEDELPPQWRNATHYRLTAEVGEMKGVSGQYKYGRAQGLHTGIAVQVDTPQPGTAVVSYNDLIELFLILLDERRAANLRHRHRVESSGDRRGGRGDPDPQRAGHPTGRPASTTTRPTHATTPVPAAARATESGSITVHHVLSGEYTVTTRDQPAGAGHINGAAIVQTVIPGLVDALAEQANVAQVVDPLDGEKSGTNATLTEEPDGGDEARVAATRPTPQPGTPEWFAARQGKLAVTRHEWSRPAS